VTESSLFLGKLLRVYVVQLNSFSYVHFNVLAAITGVYLISFSSFVFKQFHDCLKLLCEITNYYESALGALVFACNVKWSQILVVLGHHHGEFFLVFFVYELKYVPD